jgi:hypothetical protein
VALCRMGIFIEFCLGGRKKLRKEEAAMEVVSDFKAWWHQESPNGKMEREMKALDKMSQRDEELERI